MNLVIKMKIKPIDEIVENYDVSAGLGTWKMMQHWKKKGFSEDDAVDKALSYGIKRAIMSRNPQQIMAYFRDIASCYEALANILEKQLGITNTKI